MGIELDEPKGLNNVKSYFECKKDFGVFVRPNKIKVGDYPKSDNKECNSDSDEVVEI